MAFKENLADILKLVAGGTLVALHWVTFFHAIKISTISTTLVTLSSSAFFVVMINLLFKRKRFEWYELLLALMAVIGFVIIFRSETLYMEGILIALISAFLVGLFSVYNGHLIKSYKATTIAFFELFSAGVFLTIVMLIQGETDLILELPVTMDWIYLLILASVCTAYPFVVATKLLEKMSPFTIVLTTNLEPVYGIVLALLMFGEKEHMSTTFYLGAGIILCCVILNGILKNKKFQTAIGQNDPS